MKIKQKNKGITLIALIITIILMLILASVSISMIVNDEIFNYAGQAVEETKNAINNEQELVNSAINDYIKPNLSQKHNWTKAGNSFTCSHCNKTYKMGEKIEYTANETSETVTVTAKESGLDEYKETKGSYPTEKYINSTTGIQTIGRQKNEEITWIVLGIEDTDKDNIYETLLITTETPTEESMLYLYGAAAYNNGIDIINRICKTLYSNTKYGEARGMTVDDVNNALGYEKIGGNYRDKNGEYQYTVGFKTTIGDIEGARKNLTKHIGTPDGKDIFEYYNDGYDYAFSYTENEKILLADTEEKSFGYANEMGTQILEGSYYWLASRGVSANVSDENVSFTLGSFLYDSVFLGIRGCFYNSIGYKYGNALAVRPVVPLRYDLPVKK